MPFYSKGSSTVFHAHIPKTAGTSIMSVFEDYDYTVSVYSSYATPCSLQHRELQNPTLQEELKSQQPQHRFAVVRHPEERLISAYNWQMRLLELESSQDSFFWWLYSAQSAIQADPYVFDNHLRPQHEFVDETFTLLPFGDWPKIKSYLAGIIGVSAIELPHWHESQAPKLFIDGKWHREWVRDYYAKDYTLYEKAQQQKKTKPCVNHNWE